MGLCQDLYQIYQQQKKETSLKYHFKEFGSFLCTYVLVLHY